MPKRTKKTNSASTTVTSELAQRRLRRILRLLPEHVPAARKWSRQAPLTAEVSLVSSSRMRTLNRQYRGKDRPTDVLSFEAPTLYRTQGMLGELVVCLPVARAQARELGHSPARELDVLLVHGALHLLGLDHELGPAQARRMQRFEALVLTALAGPRAAQASLIGRSS